MLYRYHQKMCAKRFSVYSGRVMESSKSGFQVWTVASCMLTTNLKGMSIMKLHCDQSITQKSTWYLPHCIHGSLADKTNIHGFNMEEVSDDVSLYTDDERAYYGFPNICKAVNCSMGKYVQDQEHIQTALRRLG